MSNKSRKGFNYARLSTGFSISRRGKKCNKFAIPIAVISIVIALLAVAAVALSLTLAPRSKGLVPQTTTPPTTTRATTPNPNGTQNINCQLSTSQRFNCLPGVSDPINREDCSALGCCWDESTAPFCYHSSDSGYTVEQKFQHTALGISGCLAPKQRKSSSFGENVRRLCVNISFETEQRLHIKVSHHAN